MGTHMQKSAGGHLPEHQTQILTQGDQNLSLRTKITKLGRKHQLYTPLLLGLNQAIFLTNDTNAQAAEEWTDRTSSNLNPLCFTVRHQPTE